MGDGGGRPGRSRSSTPRRARSSRPSASRFPASSPNTFSRSAFASPRTAPRPSSPWAPPTTWRSSTPRRSKSKNISWSGKRVWQLAFTPDDSAAVHHQRQQQRRLGDRRAKSESGEVDPRGQRAVGRHRLAGLGQARRPRAHSVLFRQLRLRQRRPTRRPHSRTQPRRGLSWRLAATCPRRRRRGCGGRCWYPWLVLEPAQENDLPAAHDDLRECHSYLLGLPGRTL